MMPRPQSRAQRDAAVANRKKFALSPADRSAVTNAQLLAQSDPSSIIVVSVDVVQPQVFSDDQNDANKANSKFFALAPADRSAEYAVAHPVGICCTPTVVVSTPAVWSTWNTVWNSAVNNWNEVVYVV